jgi:hypothetical protein
VLAWPGAAVPGTARLELPHDLRWSLHKGETEPIAGWYSPGLGRRTPAFSLLGRGCSVPGTPLATRLEFLDPDKSRETAISRQAVSWYVSDAWQRRVPGIRAEAT